MNFTASYENYAQSKTGATVAKNTMPSAPEPACISVTSGIQETISPTSYQSSNCKSEPASELFISSHYAKQPKGTVLRLGNGTVITIV